MKATHPITKLSGNYNNNLLDKIKSTFTEFDSQYCITAKSLFNTTHSAMYTPDSIVRSHPGASVIQSATLKTHENTIQNICNPSFKIDTNINYNSLGMPSPSFSGFS